MSSPCAQVSDVDVAGEPEARRLARAKRLAEQRRRVAEQVAAQQAAVAAQEAAKEERGSIRDQLKPRIDQWQAGKKVGGQSLMPACTLSSVCLLWPCALLTSRLFVLQGLKKA